ncbi:MAG: hypothetical protein WBM13_09755, partial [Bacteroidia bacterium]
MKKTLIVLGILFSIVVKAQWQQITADTQGLLCISINDTVIYGATHNRVYRSIDEGATWNSGSNGLSDSLLLSILNTGTDIFVGNFVGEVFRSIDNGNSWTLSGTVVPNHRIVFLSKNNSSLYASVDSMGLFVSYNNGTTWTPINSGLTTTQVNAFAVSGTDVIIGTDSGVFISSNNGASWTSINTGLSSIHIYSLAVSGLNIFAGTDDGVFVSANNSGLWSAANYGIAGTRISALATNGISLFASCTFPQNLYAGVFISNDDGNSWHSITTGIQYFYAFSLILTSNDIYALIWDVTPVPSSSLWKRSLSEITKIDENTNHINFVQYPNPATDQLNIIFNDATATEAIVEIHDLLGKL